MSEAEQAGAPSKEPKIIKRYTNRKLYDTVESRYVTLDEIAAMIKEGTEVRIVDNRTKEDLTSVTLAQIIFEEEKKKNQMPLSVLREIIRHPGESISGFIQKEVTPRVASIREEAESRLDKLLRREEAAKAGLPETAVEETPQAAADAAGGLSPADLLKASQRAFEDWQRKIDERVKHVVENLTGNLPALGRDMQSLTQRLEELEKKLEQFEQQKKQEP
ncbi:MULTISPECIES: polyhydroxyalkanoate synthesis regulator DNA-binding domain-containing protein [Myxococcus]|uniref:polyhydroxyalkanoate synthesis regulator DNA-binding domain-containing protein n=1 Tax=Myxococcus TaxID=32 RepID=UPI0013D56082|nr:MULTISPECIES: polyhydroxyalkanoate synthesis regulator DNA-binding domain-containing protein [Myxococcus]MCP3164479.1 polyhydroxyalkanoate synthesis regulator DNA-binding domain-containing protein [Myxococcus qinghaiensis]NVJ27811.1 transcriptional regulator [Myxococcus sp. AM011]